ncbi:YcsE-related riboflavin metabolism phosphatase [[Mycoplasma] gypis]|uniref:HAD family hydrolase n=1 Tax=[Mycoplasma] gypis TaxID=92404 RepID=A0ABZ2RQ59_9BACT|nr:HAD family hydrolase [[Mycoplasma] gypis]MBN0919063.1 HAD family phosphatase [[Mycoplasma] gypis]
MKNFKLAAFDIDGTILPFKEGQKNSDLSPVIVDMFKKLKQAGFITVFCSGRDIFTVGQHRLDTPNVDYFIGANGSFILDLKTNEYIFEKTIKYDDYKVFLEATNKRNLPFTFVGKRYGYFNSQFDINHWFYAPFKENFIDYTEYENNQDDPNYLITVNSDDSHELREYYENIFKKNNLDMWVLAEWTGGVFISAKGVNKARGLEILCEKINISLDEVIAFGDSSNDVEMLSEVGLGVAMGNAEEELKSVAKDVCESVEDFGTFNYLMKKGFIK